MITQAEADALIQIPKKGTRRERFTFPDPGIVLTIPLASMDDRELFLLDVNRGRIRLTKCTFQERYRQVVILVRLDVDGPPHRNPDVPAVPVAYLAPYNGAEVPCPHLHLFVEGYLDKWAVPAPTDRFPNTPDLHATLNDFFAYCNVVERPVVDRALF